MQPTMDHLGEIGHPLLLKYVYKTRNHIFLIFVRFMSTPMGFRYLYDAGYIDREMDMWFNVSEASPSKIQSHSFTPGAQHLLRGSSRGFSCQGLQYFQLGRRRRGPPVSNKFVCKRLKSDLKVHSAFDGTVPPHFYGEMSKTELGCQILQEKGHFTDFSQFIRRHSHESEDTDLIMKLKSILWAVVSARVLPLPYGS